MQAKESFCAAAGGVFQEKTGGNAANLTNLHRVDTKSRGITPFLLPFCWILKVSCHNLLKSGAIR